jgi:uncharacterized membrane protein
MLIIPARSKETPAETKSRADQRLAMASERRQKMWRIGAAALAICMVVFITLDYVYGQNRTLSAPIAVEAVNGEIKIPLSTVSDGNLHRFILKPETKSQLRSMPVRFVEARVMFKMDNRSFA